MKQPTQVLIAITAILLSGCATPQNWQTKAAASQEKHLALYRQYWPTFEGMEMLISFARDLPQTFPFSTGTTVEDILLTASQINNETLRTYEERALNQPSEYAEDLYLFDTENSRQSGNHFILWANGKMQYWIDFILVDGKVQSIWILPGNYSSCSAPWFRHSGNSKLQPLPLDL